MTNQRQKESPRFDRETCIACSMCVNVCPTGALDLEIRNSITGFRRFPALANPQKCIGCGACADECPVGAISMTARAGT
jgi:formate hydrogenlyase subunit 6/NADH:ubiquinone oxidoreductase subunit I